MSSGAPIPLERARAVAEAIRAKLAPHCERIEIAGSIRRGAPMVSDVEIVAVPHVATDLFGDTDPDLPTDLETCVERLVVDGRLAPRLTAAGTARRGRRYQALLATWAGLAVDLFCVLPPASWGAIFTIRTGPADFSARLVTQLQRRGMRCGNGRVLIEDGRHGEREFPTPEERDFFDACGEPWAEPGDRR